MAVAEGGVGKLDRDEWLARDAIQAEVTAQHRARPPRTDQVREKAMEDDPLVVPGEGPASIVEELCFRDTVRSQSIDEPVVRLDEDHLEPCHEGVHVVPRVADERDALLVARQIATIDAKKQLGKIRLIVKIGRADRAATVQRLEIGSRRAYVAQDLPIGRRSEP